MAGENTQPAENRDEGTTEQLEVEASGDAIIIAGALELVASGLQAIAAAVNRHAAATEELLKEDIEGAPADQGGSLDGPGSM